MSNKLVCCRLIVVIGVIITTTVMTTTKHYVSCDLSLFSSHSSESPLATATAQAPSSASSHHQDHIFAGGGGSGGGGGGGGGDQDNDRYDSDDKHDRLYLFPTSRGFFDDDYTNSEADKCSTPDKEVLCKDYCESMLNESDSIDDRSAKNESAQQKSASALIGFLAEKIHCEKSVEDVKLNLAGVLRYYKSFVYSLLSAIKDKEKNQDRLIYKLEIELSKHELSKLESFSNDDDRGGSTGDISGDSGGKSDDEIDTFSVAQVHDITDILNSMLVRVETNRLLSLTEKIIDAWQSVDLLNSTLIRWFFAVVVTCASGFTFWRLNRRLPAYKLWRYFLVLAFFTAFTISVYNNHVYLSQKKQIYNQQKLKEFVPDECRAKDSNSQNKGAISEMMVFLKTFVGYTSTSKQCLEYQEALFIASGHNNYVESIVYTISESLRPIFISTGEFINQFYSALTKDLNFWQYIPLITLVTLVLLPIGLLFILLMSLIVFGYELSFFFNLINLRRPQQQQQLPQPSQVAALEGADAERRRQQYQIQRDELENIIGMIKTESSKLVSNNVTLMISDISCTALQSHLIESSSDQAANDLDLVPIDVENSSETLSRNIRRIFDRINSREYELKHQLDTLRMENFNLKETLKSREESERRAAAAAVKVGGSNRTKTKSTHKEASTNTQLDAGGGGDMNESTTSNATSNDGETTEVTSTSASTREVAIGLSRTTVIPVSSGGGGGGGGTATVETSLEQDDEDDEIYVILDEN